MECENRTALHEFVLMGIPHPEGLHVPLFLFFVIIYLLTITGNILVLLAVGSEPQLHKPMYWFLCHLSILNMAMSTVIVPKVISGFLEGGRVISVGGCKTQLFFYHFLGSTECFLYTVMAYDRFLAICKPLHYYATMSPRVCLCLSLGAWLGGSLHSTLETTLTFYLPYGTRNEIYYIFCDIPALLKLACVDTKFNEMFTFVDVGLVAMVCIVLILMSYVYILSTILKIHSVEGQRRAFSTCAAHIIVVMTCYVPLAFNYLRPGAQDLLGRIVAIFYTTLTPFLNPLIYTLRNKEMKEAMLRLREKMNHSEDARIDPQQNVTI
ncbi:olfactory receptor 10G6-like [Hemicordylus capensis]|uniref:olfactory receptor 10G6-like n=1 Tax=Hemicordylus capensis TaxID=884348 RepID=UPI0023021CEE|nr:olfactory receptor 10G6-like [Hemicordylus capensis]